MGVQSNKLAGLRKIGQICPENGWLQIGSHGFRDKLMVTPSNKNGCWILCLQIFIIFIVGIVVSRNQLIIGNIGSDYASPYERFYNQLNVNNEFFYKRTCDGTYSLEARKKLRWVFKKVQDTIYVASYNSFGTRAVGAVYMLLHAFFITMSFVFIRLSVKYIVKNDSALKKSDDVMLLLFTSLLLFIFNGHVGEFTFSVIEASFVSAALYFAITNRVILFVLITSLSVLNRESGFVLIALWFLFNQKTNKDTLYLLFPFILFVYMNADIVNCMVDPYFYIGSPEYSIKATISSSGDLVSFILAAIINHGIFFIPMSYIFLESKKHNIYHDIVRKIYFSYILYLSVFLVFTPVQHISIKYIIVPIIVVTFVIFRAKKHIDSYED